MAQQQKPPTPSSPNADQLRARIDQGMTGDKVPASDPAAAPLGTDQEAAGTRPSAAAVARDMRDSGPPHAPAAAQNARGTAERLQPAKAILILGLIGIAGTAALVAAIIGHVQQ